MQDVLNNIDLPLLLQQKDTLLEVLGSTDDPSKSENLAGILTLLDNIHDTIDPPSNSKDEPKIISNGKKEQKPGYNDMDLIGFTLYVMLKVAVAPHLAQQKNMHGLLDEWKRVYNK